MTHEFSIKCDNPKCNFVIESKNIPKGVPLKIFVNVPCPKCDNVLLTEQDFLQSEKLLKNRRMSFHRLSTERIAMSHKHLLITWMILV